MIKQKDRSTSVTKEEIIATLHGCAKKLGRVPTQHELSKMSRITIRHMQRYFGTFTQALRATGMEVGRKAVTASMSDLFRDWAAVARKEESALNQRPVHARRIQRKAISFEIWRMQKCC